MVNHANLLQILAEKGLTLGSAESLTGGLFGATFCEIPGSSKVYKGGVISYAPEIKTALLGVEKEMIDRCGVVSSDVAEAMAKGGSKALDVDICVSCTGNAGPTAQIGGEPIGKVYLGLHYRGKTISMPLMLSGDRNQIRTETVERMFYFIDTLFEKR